MNRIDTKESARHLDEDLNASLNMISEGAPDFVAIDDEE